VKRTSIYNRLKRFFCLVLALHFLNCSIDSKDPNPDAIPEDLGFNDIEHVTEFVAEIVFGWNNAFEEHDERDAEDGTSIDVIKFFFNNYSVHIDHQIACVSKSAKFVLTNTQDVNSLPREVTSPPPKA
jgi:hypothetical protein